MYENTTLPDGSKWIRYGGRKVEGGFKCVLGTDGEYKTITLENGAGHHDSYEIYISKSHDLLVVVTWDSRYHYIGGALYDKFGSVLCEHFVQGESADEFFNLSQANMVKEMIHQLHQRQQRRKND